MIEKFQTLEKYVRKSSNHWKFLLCLFPMLGSLAMAQGPGSLSQGGFFSSWFGSSVFTPLSIDNLVGWYDAGDATTISVQAGTTNVTQWVDKSAAGINLTPPSTVYPKYIVDARNGLGGIYFSGASSDRLRNAGSSIYSNVLYANVFIVAEHQANVNYATLYEARVSAVQILGTYARSSQVFEVGGRRVSGQGYAGVNLPWSSNQVAVGYGFFEWNDASLTAGLNNTTTNRSWQTAGSTPSGSTDVSVGGNNLNAELYRGIIYEIVAYNRSLSSIEYLKVINYLTRKWGIQ